MRTGKGQKGQFNVREGMAFVMEDMEGLLPNGSYIRAGQHPWLITMVDKDFVEVVMCSTLSNDSEGKHRMNILDFENTVDIRNGCPPMSSPKVMINVVSVDTAMSFPKKELFSHRLRILNENTETRNFATEGPGSLCLDKKELDIVRNMINSYISNHQGYDTDLFGIEEAEENLFNLLDGEPVPKGFTEQAYRDRFEWEHLPKADHKAVYPAESKMHSYEKDDAKLLGTVRQRDAGSRPNIRQQKRDSSYRMSDVDKFTDSVTSIPVSKGPDIKK